VLVEVTQNSAFVEKAYNNASVGQVAMIWPKPLLGLTQPSVSTQCKGGFSFVLRLCIQCRQPVPVRPVVCGTDILPIPILRCGHPSRNTNSNPDPNSTNRNCNSKMTKTCIYLKKRTTRPQYGYLFNTTVMSAIGQPVGSTD